MPFTWVTIRPGQSTPADLVYWTFIQTGRRSDPGFESVLTLAFCYRMRHTQYSRIYSVITEKFSILSSERKLFTVNHARLCVQYFL